MMLDKRNQQKIQATFESALTVQVLQSENDCSCKWYYNLLEGTEYPALQKKLEATFKFMGPEISRMWLVLYHRASAYLKSGNQAISFHQQLRRNFK